MSPGAAAAVAVSGDHGERFGGQQGHIPRGTATSASASHGEGGGSRDVGIAAIGVAGDGATGPTAAGDALGEQADRALPSGDDPAAQGCGDIP